MIVPNASEYYLRSLLAVFLLIVTCSAFSSDDKPMVGYSTSPLEDPVFNFATVIAESVVFHNWLNANYEKLDSESMKGPREHLYYLLSSYVSDIYKKDGVILPKEYDLMLESLFFWSERLGVYGAHLFYNQVKRPESASMPELMEIPEAFHISTINDMYVVKSKNGSWATKFPYYFMIGSIREYTATNGMHTQILVVSTGAAKDKTAAGRSQSTLMFIHSPSNNTEEFKNFWLARLDVAKYLTPKSLGVNDLESLYAYDKEAQLHKEVTFLPSNNGFYMVAFLGMDGTFQVNRPHYLDFLSQITIAEVTEATQSIQLTAGTAVD